MCINVYFKNPLFNILPLFFITSYLIKKKRDTIELFNIKHHRIFESFSRVCQQDFQLFHTKIFHQNLNML